MPKLYTITRDGGGKSLGPYRGLTLRECGQMVAFCAADNVGHDRKLATECGMAAEKAFKAGQSYPIDVYTFTATEEGK